MYAASKDGKIIHVKRQIQTLDIYELALEGQMILNLKAMIFTDSCSNGLIPEGFVIY